MLINLALAVFMAVVTTAIHALGMIFVLNFARADRAQPERFLQARIWRINGVVIVMLLVSLAEVVAWAVPYLALDAIDGFEKAVYFSMVTFTTLGYGDVLLDEQWRILAGFQAAVGIIMFGWTTAIVMAVIHNVYFSKRPEGIPQE